MLHNAILKIDWREDRPLFSWERMWQCEWNRAKKWMQTDGHYFLCDDYTVVDMTTMQSFNLLENDPEWEWKAGDEAHECVYLPEKGLVLAYYGREGGNEVIDCKARKRVARYASQSMVGYAGYLIGDEYWIGTEEGIVRKPFPIFEEIPERPSSYWLWAKEMERIRGEELNNKTK